MVRLQCPWPDCGYEIQDIETLVLDILEIHPAAVLGKQEEAKLQMLVVTEGVVTESNLGKFQQQLTSYRRLASLASSQ